MRLQLGGQALEEHDSGAPTRARRRKQALLAQWSLMLRAVYGGVTSAAHAGKVWGAGAVVTAALPPQMRPNEQAPPVTAQV